MARAAVRVHTAPNPRRGGATQPERGRTSFCKQPAANIASACSTISRGVNRLARLRAFTAARTGSPRSRPLAAMALCMACLVTAVPCAGFTQSQRWQTLRHTTCPFGNARPDSTHAARPAVVIVGWPPAAMPSGSQTREVGTTRRVVLRLIAPRHSQQPVSPSMTQRSRMSASVRTPSCRLRAVSPPALWFAAIRTPPVHRRAVPAAGSRVAVRRCQAGGPAA